MNERLVKVTVRRTGVAAWLPRGVAVQMAARGLVDLPAEVRAMPDYIRVGDVLIPSRAQR